MITRVTKIFTFDAAHYLPYHKGKCNKLHGHTYKLEVTVQGEPISVRTELPQTGMVIDFGVLKKIVSERVIEQLDHSYLNDTFQHPTAELMAYYIFGVLTDALAAWVDDWVETEQGRAYYKKFDHEWQPADNPFSELKLHSIRLWETPTSYAEVKSDV